MAEYQWARIEIGGEIIRPVLTRLVGSFAVFLPERTQHLIREDDQAAWGQFGELEAYLVEQAVPFDRASDGGYEHGPELRQFRPALTDDRGSVLKPGSDRTFPCGPDNRPVVTLTGINKAIAETQTRHELVLRLTGLCGLGVPPLPPLRVVERAVP